MTPIKESEGMSYLEILNEAKIEARSRQWWRVIMVIFHLALGFIVAWYLTMGVLQDNIFWVWAVVLFLGVIIVEQFIMRHIEYLVFIKFGWR